MIHYFTTPLIFAVGIIAGVLYQVWCYISLFCLYLHEGLHLSFARLLGVEAEALGFTSHDTYSLELSDDRGPIQSLFICFSPLLLTPLAVLCFYCICRIFTWELSSIVVSLVLITFGYEISMCSLPSHADAHAIVTACSWKAPVRSLIALLVVAPIWLSSVTQRFNSSFYRITQLSWLCCLIYTAYLLQSPGGFHGSLSGLELVVF